MKSWLEVVLEEERDIEERTDILDALDQAGVRAKHFELEIISRRWRLKSRCERAKWCTAPMRGEVGEIVKRLLRAAKCCENATKMGGSEHAPVLLPRTLEQIERGSGLRSVSEGVKRRIIARDGLICAICSRPVAPQDVHIDHERPVARGGDSHPTNLRVTHRICNLRKGTKLWEEMLPHAAK